MDSSSDQAYVLTVIVPTFNEEDSVVAMIENICAATYAKATPTRVLYVDDSPPADDCGLSETVLAVRTEAVRYTNKRPYFHIDAIHRSGNAAVGGLAGAVLHGISQANSPFVAVIDGDGQHPPAVLAAMLDAFDDNVDAVIATRYRKGGDPGGLGGPLRHAVSRASGWLAKAVFPRKLHHVSDPMTGCFMIRRSKINLQSMKPDGFKILLEILVTHELEVTEVPIRFQNRIGGTSKASMKQGLIYLRRLAQLRLNATRSII